MIWASYALETPSIPNVKEACSIGLSCPISASISTNFAALSSVKFSLKPLISVLRMGISKEAATMLIRSVFSVAFQKARNKRAERKLSASCLKDNEK